MLFIGVVNRLVSTYNLAFNKNNQDDIVVRQASFTGGDARGVSLLTAVWGCAPVLPTPLSPKGGESQMKLDGVVVV